MASVVDWSVDKLLSGVRTLNAQAESAQNTIRANRAAYNQAVSSLSSIVDPAAREAIRSKLREWIFKQVDVENRFNSFASSYAAAKAAVKKFLTSIHVTPPPYLGQVQLAAVPAAVWGGVAIGLAAIAIIITMANERSKSLDQIRNVLDTARARNWTAAETSAALKELSAASEATRPDLLGIGGVLKAALPVILIGGALYLFGPMLQRRLAR